MRSICTVTPKGVRWREDRVGCWVDELQWPSNEQENVILTGIVRGKGLKADRLVQVGDWGDFQIEKIVAAPLASKKRRTDEMTMNDGEKVLDTPQRNRMTWQNWLLRRS